MFWKQGENGVVELWVDDNETPEKFGEVKPSILSPSVWAVFAKGSQIDWADSESQARELLEAFRRTVLRRESVYGKGR